MKYSDGFAGRSVRLYIGALPAEMNSKLVAGFTYLPYG